ncbi:helix-turn-helix domain-containing protein, partial [Serratia ureilytica]|uniref:helix-turn-helix domain-containing protein n=1 Tax=Serratia ureilytica TaxID=300181 RepID=UPI002F960B72
PPGPPHPPLEESGLTRFAPRAPPPLTPARPAAGGWPALPLELKNWQLEQEKALIEAALQQGRFNQRKAAQLLGLTYHQLRGMLKKHALLQNGEQGED